MLDHGVCVNHMILCLISLSYSYAQDPIINLPQGRVVGIKVYSEYSPTPVEIFFGIPYANPPVGRLRFSPPERHPGWRRTLFAHKMPQRCPEPEDDVNNNYSEDCLYLNIWTTRVIIFFVTFMEDSTSASFRVCYKLVNECQNSFIREESLNIEQRVDTKLQPVVVILYSESWARGGISLQCQDLAAEGVVVVTVTYRLNIFGFFTLKSELARGNLALLDQYMALLWIKENIAAFGGDPSSVTLVGHTAGADSVLYHIFSPRAVGLFHRAIIMSPQDTTLWKSVSSNNDDAILIENISRTVADFLGCRNNSDHEILLCMKSLPIQRFAELYSNLNWTNALSPTTDNFLPQTEQYLPVSLSAALAASKSPNIQLDVLMGTTQLEAIIYFHSADRYGNMKQSSSRLYEYASTVIIPELLKLLSLDQSEAAPMLTQAIQWEFFEINSRANEKNIWKATEAIARMESSARWGAGCALLAARLARRISRLYVYRFSEAFTVDLNEKPLNFTQAVHGTDILAFLGDPLMLQIARRHSTQIEKEISDMFRQYLINFIKYGSPSSENEWPRYIIGDSNIHNICRKQRNNTCDKDAIKKEITFWLQYLPRLSQTLDSRGRMEKIMSEQDDSRLRGGVFAMSGVSAVLVLLLFISVITLHRRNQRPFHENTQTHL